MPSNWNKGFTKKTHPAVRKISETMKLHKIDNFAVWREKMKAIGKIKSSYAPLKRDGDLAELIGVVLGDGHICKYPRTEELRLTSNSNNRGFIERYANLIEKIFNKRPSIIQSRSSNSTKIGFYEKFISKRIGIPTGARKNLEINVPSWILKNKNYVIRYLRGLYEAEGSFCVHMPTSTYKFLFSNKNKALLDNVYGLLKFIGFNPHRSRCQIQISRKEEFIERWNFYGFENIKYCGVV
jgi:hypothetical protein